MLHNRLSLLSTAAVLTLVVVAASHGCDAFVVQPSQQLSGMNQLYTSQAEIISSILVISFNKNHRGANTRIGAPKHPSLVELSLSKKLPFSDVDEPKKYTAVEDGSPLGVAVVGLGFLALQLFGDRFDGSTVEQYAAPIIFCSASLAAGISRLVRNSNDWKNRNK